MTISELSQGLRVRMHSTKFHKLVKNDMVAVSEFLGF